MKLQKRENTHKDLLFVLLFIVMGLSILMGVSSNVSSGLSNSEITGEFNKNEVLIGRVITAYNVGDPSQTDSSPCIGAYGDNLCEIIGDTNIVATNEYPRGTEVLINGVEYVVMDKMNSRYSYRWDIAFQADEYQLARDWGTKTLNIEIIK